MALHFLDSWVVPYFPPHILQILQISTVSSKKKENIYTLIILYKKGYLKIVKEFELTESSKFYYSKSQILPFDK